MFIGTVRGWVARALDSKIESYAWTAILLGAWVVLNALLGLWTEITLVPWDTTSDRPPVGNWERMVNDYFEGPPGSFLIARMAVAVSALLFLWRLARPGPGRAAVPYLFAASAAATIVLMVPVTLLAGSIGMAFTPPFSGPQFNAASMATIIGLSLLLGWMLLTQASVLPFPTVGDGKLRWIRFHDPPRARPLTRADRLLLTMATLSALGVVALKVTFALAYESASAAAFAAGVTAPSGDEIFAALPWEWLNPATTVWVVVFAVSVSLNVVLAFWHRRRGSPLVVAAALHCFAALASRALY